MVKVKEGRKYSVSIVVQDITEFPAELGHVASAEVAFTTDAIDNFAMNYEAAPFWARQRILHCIPKLLDEITSDFQKQATTTDE